MQRRVAVVISCTNFGAGVNQCPTYGQVLAGRHHVMQGRSTALVSRIGVRAGGQALTDFGRVRLCKKFPGAPFVAIRFFGESGAGTRKDQQREDGNAGDSINAVMPGLGGIHDKPVLSALIRWQLSADSRHRFPE